MEKLEWDGRPIETYVSDWKKKEKKAQKKVHEAGKSKIECIKPWKIHAKQYIHIDIRFKNYKLRYNQT